MTAPLSHQNAAAGGRKTKRTGKRVTLFDQENATRVLRVLQSLRPFSQTEIAEAADISPSAVSEWLAGRRNLTFERIPDLAELYGVDSLVFLAPADEVEKKLRPHLEAIDKFRAAEMGKALASLATMERYTNKAVQVRLFEPGAASDVQAKRHLQSVT